MSDTKTPQSVKYFSIGNDYTGAAYADSYLDAVAKVNWLKECVNACEGMKDPWADILAMSTQLSVGKSLMDEKDAEIAALKARVAELENIDTVYVVKQKSSDAYSSYYSVEAVYTKVEQASEHARRIPRGGYDEYDFNPPKPQQ